MYYLNTQKILARWLRDPKTRPRLVFDPSPVIDRIPPDLVSAALDRALWISANAQEARFLTGHKEPGRAARALAQGRYGGGAVVRMGAEGAVLATAGGESVLPAHRVQVVDTNGAGDTHLGAFVAQLAAGAAPQDAARYANIAAALSITRRGPATAPTRSEVEAVLADKV